MNKINIFLGKYGLFLFFISILIFASFLLYIKYNLILFLFPIYIIIGIFYLGNNKANYIEYISQSNDTKNIVKEKKNENL